MLAYRLFLILLFTGTAFNSMGQTDTAIQNIAGISAYNLSKIDHTVFKYNTKSDSIVNALQEIPKKYLKQVDQKIEKYSNRITSKTERTLTKLSRWESKIKRLLDKASPETSARLFGKNETTFNDLLQKIKAGKVIVEDSKAHYDEYSDKLTTGLKYIATQKDKLDSNFIKSVNATSDKLKTLDDDVANTEAVEKIIKERKKQLIEESIKYIGKSKYLTKINKESYYYIETLKNYKEIFNEPNKAEEIAKTILNKVPGFQKFMNDNGALASLFGSSTNSTVSQSTAGLQTRSAITALLEEKIAAGGPNARDAINDNMQKAHDEITVLKDKINKAGGNGSDANLPDFKPNEQKSKTFLQRLELGSNIQFAKSNSLLPATTDIALSFGYKINDKSIAGLGAAYKLGLGNINHLAISNQGVGLRSFIDWKLKRQFFISGGFEINHLAQFKNIQDLNNYQDWQQSGLLGISKKYKVSKKMKGEMKLLYDFLYKQHLPVSQPIIFRIGYVFKN